MKTLELKSIGLVTELDFSQTLEIEGGKCFWDTFLGRLLLPLVAARLAESAVNELL
jgi:hypothetical protein